MNKIKMGLEIFAKQAKVEEEKKLEIIANENAIIEDLLAYFRQHPRERINKWKGNLQKIREAYKSYLQSFKITPQIVTKTSEQLQAEPLPQPTRSKDPMELNPVQCCSILKGIFLSALIQTSYNQSNNGFKFEKIAVEYFGSFLEGKKEGPIDIKVKELKEGWALNESKHCSLEAETVGEFALWGADYCNLKTNDLYSNCVLKGAHNCFLTAKIICGENVLSYAHNSHLIAETIEGSSILSFARNCTAQITEYKGIFFGLLMEDSTVWTANKETFKRLHAEKNFGKNTRLRLKRKS